MRLDKFLKITRLIKRRTLAKEVADQGRITINGNKAKASSKVNVGDELTIQYGQKYVTVRVNALKEHVKKDEVDTLYEIIKDRKSTRLNSSHVSISYAVFCLKKQNKQPEPADSPRRPRRLVVPGAHCAAERNPHRAPRGKSRRRWRPG